MNKDLYLEALEERLCAAEAKLSIRTEQLTRTAQQHTNSLDALQEERDRTKNIAVELTQTLILLSETRRRQEELIVSCRDMQSVVHNNIKQARRIIQKRPHKKATT